MKISKIDIFKFIARVASKSTLLKRIGTKLAVHLLPEEVETRIEDARFIFRPKIDGLWYLNYSDAEPGVNRVLRENLRKGDTFIDIGAYIGYYSILARNIVGKSGKVIAFEPNPESYKILKKNFEINKYTNCVAENLAVSDKEGIEKLFIGKTTDGSSSMFLVEEVNDKKYVEIRTITLDKYCEINRIAPDFIKIDAEGAEYKILKGMLSVIDYYHPKLLIEVHSRHLRASGVPIKSFFDFLKNCGYEVQLVGKEGLERKSIEKLIELCERGRKNLYGTQIHQHIFCEIS